MSIRSRSGLWIACVALAVSGCKSKKDGQDQSAPPANAKTTGTTPAVEPPPVAPSAGKVDPELDAAIRAVIAGCKIDDKGWATGCKAKEHDQAKKLVETKTAIASLESISVLANDADANLRRYVGGLSYDTISSHLGAPRFYKAVTQDPSTISADTATRLIQALGKLEGQARFYLAPAAIHAGLATKQVPALEAALTKANDPGLWNVFHTNLLVIPRLAHFDRIKALSEEGVKAADGKRVIAAITATQNLPAPTAKELEQICPWAAGFVTSSDLAVASRAAHAMIRCRGEYIDKLQAEGEARVEAGTFADPLSMAFRDICFTPVAGTAVAGSDAQCAKNFAFLEAVGTNPKLPGKVRGQALWNIYYQRRDRATLDLLRKYQSDKDPEVILQVRDAIKSLIETYKLDDGKPIPPVPTTWTTKASDHKQELGKTFSYDCPAGGTIGTVYGTKTYTHDSSICSAAVHAGKLDVAKGGKVKIVMKPGLDRYEASEQHGVKSRGYGKYDASFEIK